MFVRVKKKNKIRPTWDCFSTFFINLKGDVRRKLGQKKTNDRASIPSVEKGPFKKVVSGSSWV